MNLELQKFFFSSIECTKYLKTIGKRKKMFGFTVFLSFYAPKSNSVYDRFRQIIYHLTSFYFYINVYRFVSIHGQHLVEYKTKHSKTKTKITKIYESSVIKRHKRVTTPNEQWYERKNEIKDNNNTKKKKFCRAISKS